MKHSHFFFNPTYYNSPDNRIHFVTAVEYAMTSNKKGENYVYYKTAGVIGSIHFMLAGVYIMHAKKTTKKLTYGGSQYIALHHKGSEW